MVTLTKPNSTETQTQAYAIDESPIGLDDAEEVSITVDKLLKELVSIPKAPRKESLPLRFAHRLLAIYDWLTGPAVSEQEILRANLAYAENIRRSGTLAV